MKKNHKRISAAVLSLALGFSIAGAPVLTPITSAQSMPVTITAGQASTVDENAPVTLTIHKREGEVGNTTTGIANVPFQVQKLNTDSLATLAGWEDVLDLQTKLQTTGLDPADFNVSYNEEIDTDSSGNIQIVTSGTNDAGGNFTVGAYLVTEKAFGNYTVADPFIVTLPHAVGNSWNYTQTVTPKNQLVEVDKTVSDAGVHLGEDIAYTISASIPAEDLTSLVIIDDLPDELGAAQSIAVETVGAIDPLQDIDLALGDDYGLANDPLADANTLTVTLTPEGLTKLNNLRTSNPGLTLEVSFVAKVVALPDNGVISNDVIVNYPNQIINTGTTSDPDDGAETRLGQLTVNKIDTAGAPITGDATFQLWRCSLVGNAWTVEGPSALPVITDPNVTTEAERAAYAAGSPNGVMPTSFTTAPTGTATIYGVQAFNFENGEDTADSNICLVETEAPAGYNLNPQPVPVTDYTNTAPQTPADVNYAMVADFENLKNDELVNLPETGGYGTMALIGTGVLVAAAGGAAAVRGNRARNN